MAAEIATAYVRVRPNLSSFRSETESGVKGAFANISKLVGGAIAAVGAFDVGKHLVEAATAHQAAFAVLDKTIQNAGASATGFGASLDSVLAKEARLKGFSDEQLAAGLTTLVSVTHNTRKAFNDLGLAEDLSRARHKDLTVAALALARAEQGSTQTLSRFGIKVPEVTRNVDALKAAHDRAVVAGAKFDAQAKLEYASLLAQATAADKAATKQEALRLVQERFGGVATTFAKTSAGEFARFGQNIHQLEVALGQGLLPALTGITGGLDRYIGALVQSGSLQRAAKTGAHDIGQVLGEVKSVAETVGPPLLTVAHAALDVARALGPAPILAGLVAYKAVVATVERGAAVEALYQRRLATGQAARTREATASDAQVGVFTRLNASLQGVTASRVREAEAATAETVPTVRLTGAVDALAASLAAATGSLAGLTAGMGANAAAAEVDAAAVTRLNVGAVAAATTRLSGLAREGETAATGLGRVAPAAERAGLAAETGASRVATLGRGIGSLALGAAGGPVGAAVLGVAALAGGIAYLATRESGADRATKNLDKSLGNLGSTLKGKGDATRQLADAQTQLAGDKIAAAQAKQNLETARAALATTSAAKGTRAYQTVVLAADAALNQYRQAQRQVIDDTARVGQAQIAARQAVSGYSSALTDATNRVDGLRKSLGLEALASVGTNNQLLALHGNTAALKLEQDAAAKVAQRFADRLVRIRTEFAAGSPLVAHNIDLLRGYAIVLGHVPTRRETKIILNNRDVSVSLAQVLAELRKFPTVADARAAVAGQSIGKALGRGILTGFGSIDIPDAITGVFKPGQKGISDIPKSIREAIRRALASGIFTDAQVAKQFGVSPAQVAEIERQAKAAADKVKATIHTTLKKDPPKPITLANVVPFKIQLELARASTDPARRKALEDELAALNRELGERLTAETRRAVQLEKAAVLAQLDQLDAAARTAGATVAQTIQTAQQRVAASVAAAKQNLDRIGGQLAASIDKVLAKEGRGPGGSLTPGQEAAFKKLTADLRAGGDTTKLERAGQQLANQIQASQAKPKETTKQQIADLTDEFNRGAITLQQFNKKVAALLAADHVDYATAGKLLGRAFADAFRAQVQGLRTQAGAIAAVPARFRGAGAGGDAIRIIRPLEVLEREQAKIRAAQERIAARAERQRAQQIRAAERAAKAAEKTNAILQGSAFVAHKKPKPAGSASRNARDAARSGVRS